jgi:hypothetical protein
LGSNVDDRKSVSGFLVCINGNPVSWSSRSQKTVALSSCEAEFLAISEALREALWLRHFLTEIDIGFISPITLRVDNQSAIKLAENPVHHQRSKHIDIRYFRVRHEVAKGTVKLVYVPTELNLADVFTKATSIKTFSELIPSIIG